MDGARFGLDYSGRATYGRLAAVRQCGQVGVLCADGGQPAGVYCFLLAPGQNLAHALGTAADCGGVGGMGAVCVAAAAWCGRLCGRIRHGCCRRFFAAFDFQVA